MNHPKQEVRPRPRPAVHCHFRRRTGISNLNHTAPDFTVLAAAAAAAGPSQAAAEERTILIMVAPNYLVPLSKKLKAVAADIPAVVAHVQAAIGLTGDLAISMAVPDGARPTRIQKLSELPNKAKIQVWPLAEFGDGAPAMAPSADDETSAAAAAAVATRAAEVAQQQQDAAEEEAARESEARMIAEAAEAERVRAEHEAVAVSQMSTLAESSDFEAISNVLEAYREAGSAAVRVMWQKLASRRDELLEQLRLKIDQACGKRADPPPRRSAHHPCVPPVCVFTGRPLLGPLKQAIVCKCRRQPAPRDRVSDRAVRCVRQRGG